MEAPADYRLSPPANWALEDAKAEARLLRVAVDSLTARALKAEARVKELEAAATKTGHELTYERQMRQQAEEARDKLARRVNEQQDELSEQETEKMLLIREL